MLEAAAHEIVSEAPMTETTRRQIQQCVNCQWAKQRTQHEDNTAQGVQTSSTSTKTTKK